MNWIVLFLAGLLEIVWAVGLKYTAGFSKFWPSVATLAAMAGSVFLLAHAVKSIPLGTAYAIWTGIGAVGVAIVGMAAFGEPRTAIRIFCIFVIIAGIMGLKFFGAPPLK